MRMIVKNNLIQLVVGQDIRGHELLDMLTLHNIKQYFPLLIPFGQPLNILSNHNIKFLFSLNLRQASQQLNRHVNRPPFLLQIEAINGDKLIQVADKCRDSISINTFTLQERLYRLLCFYLLYC